MASVKMLKATNSKIGYLEAGQIVEVDEETATRWISRRIAKAWQQQKVDEDFTDVAVSSELEDLSTEQLREMAKERGVERHWCLGRPRLLVALGEG